MSTAQASSRRGAWDSSATPHSREWDSGQPEGRNRIAQRFIAGSGQPGAVESRRDDRNHSLRLSLAGILSSLRDFRAADSEPSDKSLGYFRSSLRDSRPVARRPGGSGPSVGAKDRLHSTENSEEPVLGSNCFADAFRGWRLAALPPAAFWQLFSLRVTDNFVATFTLNSAVQAE